MTYVNIFYCFSIKSNQIYLFPQSFKTLQDYKSDSFLFKFAQKEPNDNRERFAQDRDIFREYMYLTNYIQKSNSKNQRIQLIWFFLSKHFFVNH